MAGKSPLRIPTIKIEKMEKVKAIKLKVHSK